jgi:class 3 adenylate cyclase
MIRAGLKTSQERLWTLMRARAAASSKGDIEAVDRRVWDLFGETWCVMFTDLTGFSRQVEAFGILHFLQHIWEHVVLLEPIIVENDGILVKQEADSLVVLFRQPAQGLRCARAMQQAVAATNVGRSRETEVLLCVGLGFGQLLKIGDEDVYGAEVNAASKLGEDTAKANEILVTGAFKDALGETAGVSFAELTENIPGARRSYRATFSAS